MGLVSAALRKLWVDPRLSALQDRRERSAVIKARKNEYGTKDMYEKIDKEKKTGI